MQKTIYIINGPNLNLLGKREPEIYGAQTLSDVEKRCLETAQSHEIDIVFAQSNHEGQIVELIHEAREKAQGIIINPAAYTHTSIAILDALHAFDGPVIELHISQVHKRETFRHHSYVSQRADAVMAGFGTHGYQLAIEHMGMLLNK